MLNIFNIATAYTTHNLCIFVVKLANSLLRRMLVIVMVERSGKFVLKNEFKITILRFPYGASVEEFNLIILRSKWPRIVTISYRSDQ